MKINITIAMQKFEKFIPNHEVVYDVGVIVSEPTKSKEALFLVQVPEEHLQETVLQAREYAQQYSKAFRYVNIETNIIDTTSRTMDIIAHHEAYKRLREK